MINVKERNTIKARIYRKLKLSSGKRTRYTIALEKLVADRLNIEPKDVKIADFTIKDGNKLLLNILNEYL